MLEINFDLKCFQSLYAHFEHLFNYFNCVYLLTYVSFIPKLCNSHYVWNIKEA